MRGSSEFGTRNKASAARRRSRKVTAVVGIEYSTVRNYTNGVLYARARYLPRKGQGENATWTFLKVSDMVHRGCLG